MKTALFSLLAGATLAAGPALAWGDVCVSSQRQFHKEYSIMNMCKQEGGCSAYLHAVEANKALQKGQRAGCPWALQ